MNCNCMVCGAKLKKEKSSYHYVDSGLKSVYLQGLDILKCVECGEEEIVIPNLEQLHDLIAKIVARQKQKLLPEEIRFLRTHLGFSGSDFAEKIGVSPETVSRWEKGKISMKSTVEKLLRVLVLSNAGPFREYEELSHFGVIERKTPQKITFVTKRNNWVTTKAA